MRCRQAAGAHVTAALAPSQLRSSFSQPLRSFDCNAPPSSQYGQPRCGAACCRGRRFESGDAQPTPGAPARFRLHLHLLRACPAVPLQTMDQRRRPSHGLCPMVRTHSEGLGAVTVYLQMRRAAPHSVGDSYTTSTQRGHSNPTHAWRDTRRCPLRGAARPPAQSGGRRMHQAEAKYPWRSPLAGHPRRQG